MLEMGQLRLKHQSPNACTYFITTYLDWGGCQEKAATREDENQPIPNIKKIRWTLIPQLRMCPSYARLLE